MYAENDLDIMRHLVEAAVALARDTYYNRTPVMGDHDFDALVRVQSKLAEAESGHE